MPLCYLQSKHLSLYIKVYEETYESIRYKLDQDEQSKAAAKTNIPEGQQKFEKTV